jgi:ABC-type transport system involved in cytochrome c biogenesis permease subunit
MVTTHMVCTLLSYAAFLVAFVAGGLFLLQERQLKRKTLGRLFHRLPPLEVLDGVNFVALGAGWGLLTAGLAFGLVGSRLLIGRWWIEDPKAYVTALLWLAYLALWVVRWRATLRGRRVAWLSALGFCLVVFTAVGVGGLLPTLHPYVAIHHSPLTTHQ